ncbi:MAG: DUF4386 domain-containing protein [Acidimicrobiia bacterium]|nr:DUF4386 domain-containing protein [Acidimicrobiia bacterium]
MAGTGSNTGVIVGVVLELIVALACIGTAVALFPIVKKQNEVMAMGFSRALVAAHPGRLCRRTHCDRRGRPGSGRDQ